MRWRAALSVVSYLVEKMNMLCIPFNTRTPFFAEHNMTSNFLS